MKLDEGFHFYLSFLGAQAGPFTNTSISRRNKENIFLKNLKFSELLQKSFFLFKDRILTAPSNLFVFKHRLSERLSEDR